VAQKQVLVGYRLSQGEKGNQRARFLMFLWKGTLLLNSNHLPFHPPPSPFLKAKDVNLNGEYSMILLFLVG
jgi:hypothetical protein